MIWLCTFLFNSLWNNGTVHIACSGYITTTRLNYMHKAFMCEGKKMKSPTCTSLAMDVIIPPPNGLSFVNKLTRYSKEKTIWIRNYRNTAYMHSACELVSFPRLIMTVRTVVKFDDAVAPSSYTIRGIQRVYTFHITRPLPPVWE